MLFGLDTRMGWGLGEGYPMKLRPGVCDSYNKVRLLN